MSDTSQPPNGEFAKALGGEVVGRVERDGDVWVWTCDCGDQGECGTETLASTTLYFHRRSGHQQVIDVQIGGLHA